MSENITSNTVVNFDRIPKNARLPEEEKVQLYGLADDDIARAAASDPENPILTTANLAEFKPCGFRPKYFPPSS
jgi:hypothetical protein